MPSPLRLPLDELPDPLPIPLARALRGDVRPPGSKSLTNRALLLAALADGESVLGGALTEADDAERVAAAVGRLGARVERRAGGELVVHGVSGRWRPDGQSIEIDAGESGTCARFLAVAAVLSPVPVTITGAPRLRERPMGGLGEALGALGARTEFLGPGGILPVRITPPKVAPSAAAVTLAELPSSQVVTGLLLAAPFLPGGLTVRLEGRPPSGAYVRMTVGLLDCLGVVVRSSDDGRVLRVLPGAVAPPRLPGFSLSIEPDASSAGYFWAAAAIIPGSRMTVRGLSRDSLQGDAHLPLLLARMGAGVEHDADSITVSAAPRLAPIIADFADMPDAAMTIAAAACFAEGPSMLTGLRTLRDKESDRVAALQTELGKVGVQARPDRAGDTLTITPPRGGLECSPRVPPVVFETSNDHRMAMSLALIGLRRPNTAVNIPRCVSKTYPGFWRDLHSLLA